MKRFSNRYIYIYSIVLVVVVATLLALVAVGLKPFQQSNIKAEKMQQLLQSAGINVQRDEAEEAFEKYITKELAVDEQGNVLSEYSNGRFSQSNGRFQQSNGKFSQNIRPFNIDVKKAYKAYKSGKDAALPVYVCNKDGEQIYIVPIRGNGLWGDIWGNIALKSDMNTLVGVTFDHESETPGLGARIKDDPSFAKSFVGKTIFEGDDFVSVEVKKRVGTNMPHAVDALTGATLTSNGTSNMIKDCLQFYLPYFKNNKK